jgi:assimilatory nitrate reductase catalytic subunit
MTNLEGRVLRCRRVRPPVRGVIDDIALLALLAGRLSPGRCFSADFREVLDELRRASTGEAAG